MLSVQIKDVTRRDWRELGFYYDRDDEAKEWRLAGSKNGLRGFAKLLRDYAADQRNELISEHEHYGPYMYLKIGTWASAEITENWIAGPLSDIFKLAEVIDAEIDKAKLGEYFKLRDTFAASSSYDIVLEVKNDSFDPASSDALCW